MLWGWVGLAVYAIGVVFLLGALVGEYDKMVWQEWGMVFGWPACFTYSLIWGRRQNRRWYCWLTSHDDHEVTRGVTFEGEMRTAQQCQRCWRTTDWQEDAEGA